MQRNLIFYRLIGRRIRKLRQAQNYTVQEMADRALMHIAALSKIENGKRRVSVIELLRLARLLQCSVDSLLGEESENAAE